MAALTLALGTAPLASAQPAIPAGGQFQVNTYTTLTQQTVVVAADANGDFVVVWNSAGSFGTDTNASVQGQRYASNGSTLGAQFQINSYTTDQQAYSSVAADADGDFIVVWTSIGSSGTDTGFGNRSIQGQRYASNGSAQGAEFQVNTYTTDSQNTPSVTADADGDFVVVWTSIGSSGTDTSIHSIQGQRYTSSGSPQGAQFQVNTYTTLAQVGSSVSAEADGDFVVVWQSNGSFGTDTNSNSIQGQRYASNGSTLGAQFQVNTYTTNGQDVPSVAMDADGDFVVVWQSAGSSGSDTNLNSIQGQRYASGGSTQGAQFQVNTYTTGTQVDPSVTADAGGGFVVVWSSNGSSGTDTSSESIHGRRYGSDGSAQGAQFQVNTYTTSFQLAASVAADDNGNFVVGWASAGSYGTDTNGSSVQGQRYRAPIIAPAMASASRFALAAALLLLGAAYALRRR